MVAYAAEIERFALRILGSASDAEDVCQETFTRALGAFSRFDGAQPRAWLYRIAANACTDRLRVRGQEQPWPQALDVVDASASGEDATWLPEPRQVEELRKLIATLPRRQREALCLRRLEGLGYSEVAERMGGTPEAARANVYQAIRRLRRCWTRFEREGATG